MLLHREIHVSRWVLTVAVLLTLIIYSLAFAQECNDPIPEHCNNITFLGEDDNGCACFVCNTGTEQRQVVCTRNPDHKESLFMRIRRE